MKPSVLLVSMAAATAIAAAQLDESPFPSDQEDGEAANAAKSREKRFVVSTLVILGTIATAASTTVNEIDRQTDSAAFYPSIRRHKRRIKYYARRIESIGGLYNFKRTVRQLELAFERARTVEGFMRQWLDTMSKMRNTTKLQGSPDDIDVLVPESLRQEMPIFNQVLNNLVMPTLEYTFLGVGTYSAVSTVTSQLAGTLSTATAAFAAVGGVLSTVASAVSIGMVISNGANKRDQYRDLAARYKDSYEKLERARRDTDELWEQFRTFMESIKDQTERIVSEELHTPCDVGLHGEATHDLVGALAQNWIILLKHFTDQNERYQDIKNQINFHGSFGKGPAETFHEMYRDDHSMSSLILKGLRENGIDEDTMGRWGPWRDRGDGSCTRNIACGGIETRVRRRRCLTGSCVGNPFQKVVCSLGSSQQGPIPQACNDANLRSLLPNPMLRYYSTVVNHICGLAEDPVVYRGMSDAFTERPTGGIQALIW